MSEEAQSDQYVVIPQEVGPSLFGPASLHLSDYPAYWDNLCENIKTRINAYLNK